MKLSIIDIAKITMTQSKDPIHDYDHVARVATLCEQIGTDAALSEKDMQTLQIAAWWHDTSRTITTQSSFIILTFFDDFLSASLLLYHAIRTKNISRSVIHASLILFAKTIFLYPFFSRFSKRKDTASLLHILEDADSLDMISRERSDSIMKLVQSKPRYRFGYKIAISWFLSRHLLTFNTNKAKEILILHVEEFLEWIYEPETMQWHKELFSEEWVTVKLQEARTIIQQLKTETSLI